MMPEQEVKKLKFQLYESREKFNNIIKKINKQEPQPESLTPIFELITQIYTEKISLLDVILNHNENTNNA